MSIEVSPKPVRRRPAILTLTSLRYFAAASVVIFHIAPRAPAILPGPLMNAIDMCGDAAVCFFFTLSGFILVYSDIDNEGRMRKTQKDFWRARFARIYPVYLFALLVALLPTYWGLESAHGRWGAVSRMLIYGPVAALLLQSWLPWTSASWNAPGWSLSCEALFYALFPRLGSLYKLSDFSWTCVLFAVWCATVLPSVFVLSLYHHHTLPPLLVALVNYDPLLRLPEFIGGMVIGMLWIRRHQSGPDPARRSALYTGSLLLIILLFLFLAHIWVPRAVLFPLFLLLIYRLACDHSWLSRLFEHPWLVRLGEASYSMYILHIPIWVYVQQIFHIRRASGVTMVLYIFFITAVSMMTYEFIEKSWMRRLRPNHI